MKIRIAFAGLLLVSLAAACSSPTAPSSAADAGQRAHFDEAPAGDDKGGGTMGTGN